MRVFTLFDHLQGRCLEAEIGDGWQERCGIEELSAGKCPPHLVGTVRLTDTAPSQEDAARAEVSGVLAELAKELGVDDMAGTAPALVNKLIDLHYERQRQAATVVKSIHNMNRNELREHILGSFVVEFSKYAAIDCRGSLDIIERALPQVLRVFAPHIDWKKTT